MVFFFFVFVIIFFVVDLDFVFNSYLIYVLREGDKGVIFFFQINSVLGEIICNQILDREQVFQYKVLVVVIDFGKLYLNFVFFVYLYIFLRIVYIVV